MIRAVRGYGLIKAGETATGTAELAEAVAWFDRSHLRYTRSLFSLWLGEGYMRCGERQRARVVLDEALATSRELGYRYLEGMARRLLGEILMPEDLNAAIALLETAVQILEDMGARNEVAKALVTQSHLRRAVGDCTGARSLLEHALTLFNAIGTVDEPTRVRTMLVRFDGSQAS
jgi:hypothetical protein